MEDILYYKAQMKDTGLKKLFERGEQSKIMLSWI